MKNKVCGGPKHRPETARLSLPREFYKRMFHVHTSCASIDVEYFQGYGSPFLLKRCQGPESRAPKNFTKIGPGNDKMASKRWQTHITRSPNPEIIGAEYFRLWEPILTQTMSRTRIPKNFTKNTIFMPQFFARRCQNGF